MYKYKKQKIITPKIKRSTAADDDQKGEEYMEERLKKKTGKKKDKEVNNSKINKGEKSKDRI